MLLSRVQLWNPRARVPIVRALSTANGTVKNQVCDEQDLEFQLFHVLEVQRTLFNEANPRFKMHSPEFVRDALKSASSVAADSFAPHNRKNDLNEPKFDGKRVTIIPEVKEALSKFYEAGLGSAHADEALGGMQLPSCVTNAFMVPFYSANIGTITFPFLTIAAGNMLRKYGSESQIRRFLLPMLEGRFTGTVRGPWSTHLRLTNTLKMNLSETQAGSSLGDITTKAFARPGEPGRYDIRGAKM
jgi:alkylation response protein AidB-like acyl-CoA dehydrogenase